MKKIYRCFIIILLAFGLTACGNEKVVNSNTKENGNTDLKISFDPGQSFTMAKSLWYDDTNVLLVFGDNKENEHSKIISYNLETKNSKVLFEGQLLTGSEDHLLVNENNWLSKLEKSFFL
ncbi:LptM family lipoprotein [Syntrophobotulus glycolicus]|uniref:LptM family lipoprotein n=1 Tax=Syntrophobotulus glycolicus TaxID=51197 RepID=UPI000307B035|nr:hypothetical protein [Syntrophobotulus glycolicus]